MNKQIMKTKLMLIIGAVALVTLSFTFANVETDNNKNPNQQGTSSSSQIGGLISDEVVK